MRYEPIFGDQSLFDKATRKNTVAIYKISENLTVEFDKYEELLAFLQQQHLCDRPDIAMRRIIRTPTWTVEDKKAGKLPEVGCRVFDVKNENEVTVKAINNRQVCLESNCGFIYLLPPDDIKPIESPEEKAARLRAEWYTKAREIYRNSNSDFKAVYDALLSGDLPVPVKGE